MHAGRDIADRQQVRAVSTHIGDIVVDGIFISLDSPAERIAGDRC